MPILCSGFGFAFGEDSVLVEGQYVNGEFREWTGFFATFSLSYFFFWQGQNLGQNYVFFFTASVVPAWPHTVAEFNSITLHTHVVVYCASVSGYCFTLCHSALDCSLLSYFWSINVSI